MTAISTVNISRKDQEKIGIVLISQWIVIIKFRLAFRFVALINSNMFKCRNKIYRCIDNDNQKHCLVFVKRTHINRCSLEFTQK